MKSSLYSPQPRNQKAQAANRSLSAKPNSSGMAAQASSMRSVPIQRKPMLRAFSQEWGDELQSPAFLHGKGEGKKLPETVQQKMENSFGADFSKVRIHEGSQAEQIGAIAFTRGHDIHFAPGKYNPTNLGGQALLGHELAHVLQQRANRVALPPGKDSPINSDVQLEQEADRLGEQAAQGKSVSLPEAYGDAATVDSASSAIAPVQCVPEMDIPDSRHEKFKSIFGIGRRNKRKGNTEKMQKLQAKISQEENRNRGDQSPDQEKIEGWKQEIDRLGKKNRKIGLSKHEQAFFGQYNHDGGLEPMNVSSEDGVSGVSILAELSANSKKADENTIANRFRRGLAKIRGNSKKASPSGVNNPALDPEMHSSNSLSDSVEPDTSYSKMEAKKGVEKSSYPDGLIKELEEKLKARNGKEEIM